MEKERVRRDSGTAMFEVFPAVPAVCWLACGIVFGYRWYVGQAAGLWTLGSVVLAAAAFVFCRPRRLRILVLLFPLGAGLAAWRCAGKWETYRDLLPRPACGVSIRGIVVTADAVPVPGVKPMGGSVEVLLRAIRVRGSKAWRPCGGRLLIALPPGASYTYGSLVEARGALLPPAGPVLPSAFDYRRYLYMRGIRHILYAEHFRTCCPARGWRRLVGYAYAFRRWCGGHLTSGVEDRSQRQVLVAMALGFRQGLPAALRERFLRSGAIHIFAISGLHVCIVWSLLSIVLRASGMPYRAQHLVAPLVLGFYVLMTGAAPSAVRAWTMIAVLCISQGLLRVHMPLNAVAVAALLLLLVNPLHLFQTGFVFSFTIVTVLVLGWPHVCALISTWQERRLWVPRHYRDRFSGGSRWGIRCSGAAILAWFGSAGLVAFSNGLIIPGALVVNVFLSTLAWCTLALCGPKILASCIAPGWMNAWLGHLLGSFLGAVEELVRLGAVHGASLGVRVPPSGVVAAYYLGLVGMLWPRIRRSLRAAFGVLFLCAALTIVVMGARSSPLLAVWYGGESAQPVVLVDPGGELRATLVNSGGAGIARQVDSVLRVHGLYGLDLYVAATRHWDSVSGAARLLRNTPAACVALPTTATGKRVLLAPARQQLVRGGRVRWFAEPHRAQGDGGLASAGTRVTAAESVTKGRRIHMTFAGGGFVSVDLRQDRGGRLQVTWRCRDGTGGTRMLCPRWRHSLVILSD